MSETPNTEDELATRRKKRGTKPGRKPGTKRGPVSGAKEIEQTKKEAEALALRLAGANLQQIAERLGYKSVSSAHDTIMHALKTILPDQTRDEHRALELARLDRLEMGHWAQAIAGDDKSAMVVLRVIGMRAKLLGLEAPVRVSVDLYDGDLVEVGVLSMLDEEGMANALKLRDQVAELSRMRAGAIEAETS